MAVSEGDLNSWKTPFSTPIRKDENACRDLFLNSEKLLASAVSICRLKGSVECQTGGLITVCEELQSLIRLAFSEIRRLEKEFKSQRSQLEDEVSCLKERVKYLEEGTAGSKPLNAIEKQQNKVTTDDGRNRSREPEEVEESESETNCLLPEVEDTLEESDPNIFDVHSTDDNVVSVGASSPKDQKVSRSPQENKKSSSKKKLKKMTSKKGVSLSSSMSGVDNANSQEISSMATEVDAEKQGLESKSEAVSATEVSTLDHGICGSENNSKKEQRKRNLKRSTSKDRAREKGKINVSASKSKGQKRSSLENLENNKLKENKQEKEVSAVAEMSEAELQEEPKLELKGESKGTEEKTKTKKKQKSSQDEMQPDDANQQGKGTKKKKSKKKRSVEVEEESNEVFEDDTPSSKAEVKSKGKKKESPVHKTPEEKLNKKLSRNKKSKAASDDNLVEISEEVTDEQFQLENSPENPASKPQSSFGGMASTNEKSAKKESAIIEDKDEPLGDMSFLINVNSRISVFVADASQDECELDPMTARERNDVYKVAQLYKLRARIGTKAENNLTTVRLSKQADTQMPKPGRVDRLLSELSIAASKDSPKSQVKRKHAATVDENEQSVTAGNDLHCDGPPKKKLPKLSRTKKM